MSNATKTQPLEVSLVHDVKNCRTCQWFWGGVPPYGPYTGFDWTEDYPEQAIHEGPQSADAIEPTPWLKGVLKGSRLVDPGVMHGCRKAPIMTIGINPNMTAYFASTSGARWAYPWFEVDNRYAYYYRHFTIYQESVSLDYVRQHLDGGKRLDAEADGWLVSTERGADHRFMLLTVQYQEADKPTVHELAWTPEERWVVVQDRGKEEAPDTWFKKGDPLAGVFTPPTGTETEIYENPAGYYQRMIPVLDAFKKKVGLQEANLTVGEDVAQHDMIGTASPGWSSKYDIPTETITRNCVHDHGWVVSQFIQSQPAVVILVGGSAVEMFRQIFGPYMDLSTEGRDIFQLLKETTTRRYYVNIDIQGLRFRSRILTPAHFSYGDNFYQQSRLSPDAWVAFEQDFKGDVQVLGDAKRIWPPAYNGVVAIRLDGPDDEIKQKVSVEGWQVLMAYYVDPFDMLASALAEEYEQGVLGYDQATGHLARVAGPCRYCVNDLWSFPEGCAYGKPDEKPYAPGYLESIVDEILEQAPVTGSSRRERSPQSVVE